jgi:hypothetical protein
MTGKLSARLLAIACLAVGLATLAITTSADARPGQGPDPFAGKMYIDPPCPARTVCLYPHTRLRGKVQKYGCGRAGAGRELRADLTKRFTPGRVNGVSSYKIVGLPKVTLWDGDEPYPVAKTAGNVLPWFNDRARELVVTC